MFNAEEYKKNVETFQKSFTDMMKNFSSPYYKEEKNSYSEYSNKLDQASKIIFETMQRVSALQIDYFNQCSKNMQNVAKTIDKPSIILEESRCNTEQALNHISEIAKIIAESRDRLLNIS